MKNLYFPHFCKILRLQVSQRRFTDTLKTICKWEFPVNGQIFFNGADNRKNIVSVLCLNVFGHTLLYE